jgi:hypothetical protein
MTEVIIPTYLRFPNIYLELLKKITKTLRISQIRAANLETPKHDTGFYDVLSVSIFIEVGLLPAEMLTGALGHVSVHP